MNIHLLEWGLVSFIIGVILSLLMAAIYYDNSPPWAKLFTNPRKLKSAHYTRTVRWACLPARVVNKIRNTSIYCHTSDFRDDL
ncbi:hypothetical protein [Bacillus xiapuensis]|uniref:Uncharacterized protein n=1 Tax=Bacillus xiapuensis TaxID=2014075 RepID=A0ABU6N9F6_9BACI|nr:hypothetical protein [Bacillus xiapuensis]